MKPTEQKAEFVRLRAEGRSYSAIAEALNISKSTCTSWDRELAGAIAELKQEQLEDLYNAYYVTKEARIKALGETLGRINTAIGEADLRDIPPEKLLDLKLKYIEALKGEYAGPAPLIFTGEIAPKDIMAAMGYLLNGISTGEIPPEQAGKVSAAFIKILQIYSKAEMKASSEDLIGAPGRVHIYIPDNGRRDMSDYEIIPGEMGPEYAIQPQKARGRAGKNKGAAGL